VAMWQDSLRVLLEFDDDFSDSSKEIIVFKCAIHVKMGVGGAVARVHIGESEYYEYITTTAICNFHKVLVALLPKPDH